MGLFGPDVQKLKEKRDINGLMKALQNKKADTRREAAEALGHIGGPEVLPALMTALGDADARVRVYGVQGLARQKDPSIENALKPLVADPDWEVRKETLAALIKAGGSAEAMLNAIRFNSAELRELAAVRLGDVGGEQAVNALMESLNDEEEVVRLRATNSLKKILADPKTAPALADRIKSILK
jgi:HEAT repeat protein